MEKLSCWGVLFTETLVAMVKAAFWIQRETVSNRNPRNVNLKVDQKNPQMKPLKVQKAGVLGFF